MDKPNLITRRQFIRRAACAAVGTSAITSTLFDLRLINALMAQGAPTDYKALVCVFLFGGNDGNNLLVPRSGSEYDNYLAARGILGLPSVSLLPITPLVSDGRDYGFHPNCPELQTLFGQGKLAFLSNVGPLVYPITKSQYQAHTVPVPAQLFSHNDQQVFWQTSISDQASKTGWGGRCADLIHDINVGAQISMCISLSGTNFFEMGNVVQQYQVTPAGSVGLSGLSTNQLQAVKDLIALPHSNLFEKTYAQITDRGIQNDALLSAALNAAPPITTAFPATTLGDQLKMVARLISARNGLNMKRQIFFCSVGGYDTHGEQINTQGALLTELSQSLKSFYDATVEMSLSDKVTAFTASDFGRTFPTNGVGSDHGWGGHQLIVGGAVRGQYLYGTYPTLAVNGPDDTKLGRWIPTTAVDEYSATLAKWFGISNTDLNTVFPNLGRFAHTDLGFML